METLTVREAYRAMYFYLEDLRQRTNSDDFAEFLGAMSLLPDGGTADPALWDDWMSSVAKAWVSTDHDIRLKFK